MEGLRSSGRRGHRERRPSANDQAVRVRTRSRRFVVGHELGLQRVRHQPQPDDEARPTGRLDSQIIAEPADPPFESYLPEVSRQVNGRVFDGLDHLAEPGHLLQNGFQLTDQPGQDFETVCSDGLVGESGIGRRLDRSNCGFPLVASYLHLGLFRRAVGGLVVGARFRNGCAVRMRREPLREQIPRTITGRLGVVFPAGRARRRTAVRTAGSADTPCRPDRSPRRGRRSSVLFRTHHSATIGSIPGARSRPRRPAPSRSHGRTSGPRPARRPPGSRCSRGTAIRRSPNRAST